MIKTLVPLAALFLIIRSPAYSQVLGADFVDHYTVSSLGSIAGVPANYGGLTFKFGDPDTLLIGGAANGGGGAVYSIGVARDPGTGSISGFSGPAVLLANTPFIDGGLAYGPDEILFYTTYNNNTIGQIQPGSSSADKITSLTSLGVASSTGSLAFVPAGFAGAGSLKVASYSTSRIYDVPITPDGSGAYTLGSATEVAQLTGGVEGIVYIKGGLTGNIGFSVDSMLVSEYQASTIAAYDLDANGNPIPSTRRIFISSLGGAEGGTIDPVTGDFFFSTFGSGNEIIKVTGFVPEPSAAALLGIALSACLFSRRRN